MRMQKAHLLGIVGFLLVLGISLGLIFGIGFEKRPEPTDSLSLQPTPRPGEWKQLGIDIDGEADFNRSGEAVSLSADGTVVAIGAKTNDNPNGERSGHVRLYEYDSSLNGWVKLGSDINGEEKSAYSGGSVSLSADGTRVAIGALGKNGYVRVYEYDTSLKDWIQLGEAIFGERNFLGSSVSLSSDGTKVAIGANDSNFIEPDTLEEVRVYEYDSSSVTGWVQLGTGIEGILSPSSFRDPYAVSLSADGLTVAVGAEWNDGNGFDSGHVRVYGYDLSSDDWIQLGDDIYGEPFDSSGYSVSLSSDGTRVAFGAPWNTVNAEYSGQVRVYQYNPSASSWLQLGDDIDGEAAYDESGWSVSLSSDGMRVAIGAPANNNDNGLLSGHVRVYEYDSSSLSWKQLGADIDGEGSDSSGWAVSLSSDGTIVAMGAPYNGGNGKVSGHVRVFAYHSSSNA